MTECIILLRIPSSGRVVCVTQDANENPEVFANRDEAIEATKRIPVLEAGYPYQIVELDEL